jgi:hypothetical protein
MRWRRWPVCKRVLVNMDDGRAFDGILYARRGPLLILRQAKLIELGGESIDVEGEIIVERPRVSFIQVQP